MRFLNNFVFLYLSICWVPCVCLTNTFFISENLYCSMIEPMFLKTISNSKSISCLCGPLAVIRTNLSFSLWTSLLCSGRDEHAVGLLITFAIFTSLI